MNDTALRLLQIEVAFQAFTPSCAKPSGDIQSRNGGLPLRRAARKRDKWADVPQRKGCLNVSVFQQVDFSDCLPKPRTTSLSEVTTTGFLKIYAYAARLFSDLSARAQVSL